MIKCTVYNSENVCSQRQQKIIEPGILLVSLGVQISIESC